jgi:hypothetical protein
MTTRYPSFNVLDKRDGPDWDTQTRQVVHRRLTEVPPNRFFNSAEAILLQAIVDRIVPQPDRDVSTRIQIVPWVDEKLYEDRRDGYRYEDVPPLREAWRGGLASIEETARLLHGHGFARLTPEQQDRVLDGVAHGNVPPDVWRVVPPRRFFRDVLCLTVVKIYYAHPAAWNEIGYNGPSSPRGHVRIWLGGVDPWEAQESR